MYHGHYFKLLVVLCNISYFVTYRIINIYFSYRFSSSKFTYCYLNGDLLILVFEDFFFVFFIGWIWIVSAALSPRHPTLSWCKLKILIVSWPYILKYDTALTPLWLIIRELIRKDDVDIFVTIQISLLVPLCDFKDVSCQYFLENTSIKIVFACI